MQMKRALVIAGDFYHDSKGLKNFISEAGGAGIQWDWSDFPPEIDLSSFKTGAAADYDLVIIASENRINPETGHDLWMDKEFAASLSNWVEGGGGFISLHTGMASYNNIPEYENLVGGRFEYHPKEHPEFSIIPVEGERSHPLLKGIHRFSIKDELYFVKRDPLNSTLLAISESPEYGSSAALWYRIHGEGRVVGMTPGHNEAARKNPRMIQMLGNAVNWCLGEVF